MKKEDNRAANDGRGCLRTGAGRDAAAPIIQIIQIIIERMLFLGFTLQILLGLVWMCRNFGAVQDFRWNNLTGEDFGGGISSLWGKLYEFLGQVPQAVYILQLLLAFYAGYRFLGKHGTKPSAQTKPGIQTKPGVQTKGGRNVLAVWGSLALLTFPFAMQCHLAVLPYSAMASLFLLMLSFLTERIGGAGDSCGHARPGMEEPPHRPGGKSAGAGRGGRLKTLAAGVICGMLAFSLAAAAGVDERDSIWGRGPEAALASRLAWSGMWYDLECWPEELQALTGKNLYRASGYPGNMRILLEDIAEGTDPETARQYYWEIAGTGWKNRTSLVIRQIGWDLLGYGVSPLVVPFQLQGRAYDSYTGRNYEAMGGHSPVLTGYYVYYGCWWFGCCLILTALWLVLRILQGGIVWKKVLLSWGIWGGAAGIVVILYTLRGAGLMDYRCTVAVNQLWLAGGLLCMDFGRRDRENKGQVPVRTAEP